jgi:hypothetical protein
MDEFISLAQLHKSNDTKEYECIINKQLQKYFNEFQFDKLYK